MKTNKAAIDPLTLTVLATACVVGIFVPNARPWRWSIFQKAPPTQQLKVDMAELDKAKKAQADAEAKLKAIEDKRDADTKAQLTYAQQMAVGASDAISRVPDEHRTQEVLLAGQLLDRTNTGLSSAIGALPIERQREILDIVAKSLSKISSERDEALKKLQEKDAELRVVTAEKVSLEKQVPELKKKVDDTSAKLSSAEQKVTEQTAQVITYAEKIAAKEKEAGSLNAQVSNIGRLTIIIAILYVFVHFILPSLAQEFPAFQLLSVANKAAKSVFSSHS